MNSKNEYKSIIESYTYASNSSIYAGGVWENSDRVGWWQVQDVSGNIGAGTTRLNLFSQIFLIISIFPYISIVVIVVITCFIAVTTIVSILTL